MNRISITAVLAVLLFSVYANAGSIRGRISGVSGPSVVYVDTVPGKSFPPPAEHPVLSEKSMMFQPHLLVVQQGTTVDFVNADKVSHNVFWPFFVEGNFKVPGKNLGTWPQGQKRSFKFEQSGIARLFCNVHPEMSGFLIVTPTPYFALTDDAGNYKIDNIPDGQYKLVGWHENAKTQDKPVAVSGDSTADFSLGK